MPTTLLAPRSTARIEGDPASPATDASAQIEVLLRDGGAASLRPMAPGESDALDAVLAGMSAASRQSRYLVAMPVLPASYRRALSDVDGDRHVAWLSLIDDEVTGIARYVRLPPDHLAAEFAFEVVDRHHGRGLARLLLDAVTAVAAARGVQTLRATLLPDNRASRRLLAADDAHTRVADGLLEVEAPLHPPSASPLDLRRVVDLQNLYTQGDVALAH